MITEAERKGILEGYEKAKSEQKANEKNEKLWAEIQAMNTIPIAKVQKVLDFMELGGWARAKTELKELLSEQKGEKQ